MIMAIEVISLYKNLCHRSKYVTFNRLLLSWVRNRALSDKCIHCKIIVSQIYWQLCHWNRWTQINVPWLSIPVPCMVGHGTLVAITGIIIMVLCLYVMSLQSNVTIEHRWWKDYCDVRMGTMASQITSLNHCLLSRLFGRRSKKTSNLRVTGLCAGNLPVAGDFPAQRASNAKKFPFDDVIMRIQRFYSKKIGLGPRAPTNVLVNKYILQWSVLRTQSTECFIQTLQKLLSILHWLN